jgi:phosphoribosyl-AMP cyclohydrolase / phosphoribosyl-ATP pyrophosphohydrolase
VIIPSIDLMGGHAVQLIGGKEKALDAGDPRPLAETFKLAGEIAVIDLDAALGQGDNGEPIRDLLKIAPCRVGGGIRSIEKAIEWLDAGAQRIILGTAAKPEILEQLPRERVIAALDAYQDEVVVDGWREKTGRTVIDRMRELQGLVGAFMVTFVEREGRLEGLDHAKVAQLVEAAGDAHLTVAGGVTTLEDIAQIDRAGADAQVGMALYTNKITLADAIAAPLKSDRPDGLWPTVVVDEFGVALGLAYSNLESVRAAVEQRRGIYHSRSRGGVWIKGETSGATQALQRIDLDCDRDTLRFTVRQAGAGFCHRDTWTCWGPRRGLPALLDIIAGRKMDAPAGSYTRRLFEDRELLGKKLLEEARELAEAEAADDVAWEAADVVYFTLVAMARAGVDLSAVEAKLAERSLKVTRRKGDAKPNAESP